MTAPALALALHLPAPARTGRQQAALTAAARLLALLGDTVALHLSVGSDFAADLPVRLEAQIGNQIEDPTRRGGHDAARLARLQAAARILHAPVVPAWGMDGRAFALADVAINGVPVHVWTAFDDPHVLAAARALAISPR